jgi:hypothetical protein
MRMKLCMALLICVALFESACGSSQQNLILGKWQAEAAVKMTAEFNRDGTAKLTILGQTVQGNYKLEDGDLVWTLNGRTTRGKVSVTATELKLTDDQNRTIQYRRD